jgi:DNA-binding MarR family transcriptional regulator
MGAVSRDTGKGAATTAVAGEPGDALAPAAVAEPTEDATTADVEPIFSLAATTPFQAVGFMLSSIGYAVGRRFHQVLEPLELEPREFALLRAVGAAEGQSQQAVGERLQIPPSRMVAFVDALERRGLLERRHNPQDRRTRALHLTDDGRELLGRAFVIAAALEHRLCEDLSVSEREQLLTLLRRVGQQLGVPAGAHAAHAAMVDE